MTESHCLREKLSQLNRDINLNKMSRQEYESGVSQIIEAISKITKVNFFLIIKLNDEENNLLNKIKNKMMNSYEKDKGIDQQSKNYFNKN